MIQQLFEKWSSQRQDIHISARQLADLVAVRLLALTVTQKAVLHYSPQLWPDLKVMLKYVRYQTVTLLMHHSLTIESNPFAAYSLCDNSIQQVNYNQMLEESAHS